MRVMHAGTAFVTTWSQSITVYCTELWYIVKTVHGNKQCCMTEQKYQTDSIMCIMQALMETGMLQYSQGTTHNATMWMTPVLPMVV